MPLWRLRPALPKFWFELSGSTRHQRGHAFLTHQTQFARRQADLSVTTVTTNELSVCAGSTGDLTALALLQSRCCGRSCRSACPRTASRCPASRRPSWPGDHLVADAKTLRCQDVVLFAVFVFDQRDKRGAVGSYSIRSTVAGTSSLLRLKSTIR